MIPTNAYLFPQMGRRHLWGTTSTPRRQHMGLIMKHGMLKDIRGSPSTIRETVSQSHSSTTEHRLHLICSDALIEAIYLAVETAPENLQVIQTKKLPIQNMTIFNPKTPIDVLHYVRDLANISNMLNGAGSNISFAEVFANGKDGFWMNYSVSNEHGQLENPHFQSG